MRCRIPKAAKMALILGCCSAMVQLYPEVLRMMQMLVQRMRVLSQRQNRAIRAGG